MKPIPMLDLEAQYHALKPQIDAAIQRVLDHRQFILGPEVRDFEAAFARHVGAAGGVGVGSGTAALKLSLQAIGVGPGDRVITVAQSFIATPEAISQVGARPLFVDVDPRTFNMDPEKLREGLANHDGDGRIKAILPVHLYGQPADLDPILQIAADHDLPVIEDAAQAHGAEYKGRRVGAIGTLGTFSFYPGKNLGAFGDAGIVTGNDEALLALVGRLRNHGRTAHYEHQEIGWCDRMDSIQGAVLAVKLQHLEDWTEARRRHAAQLDGLLRGIEGVTPPHVMPDVRHVYHLYTIRARRRDALHAHLVEKGIGARVHNGTPLHLQPAYAEFAEVPLPVTCAVAGELLSLPVFPEMDQAQLRFIADTVREFYE